MPPVAIIISNFVRNKFNLELVRNKPCFAHLQNMVGVTYVHGTQKKAKGEIDQMITKGILNYPLFYLQAPTVEKHTNDEASTIASKAQVRIWFLLKNKAEWTTDEHYEQAVTAMHQMATEFMDQLYYYNVIAEPNDHDIVPHVNVGSESEYGHLRDLLSDPHSGVLLNALLSIEKENCCC